MSLEARRFLSRFATVVVAVTWGIAGCSTGSSAQGGSGSDGSTQADTDVVPGEAGEEAGSSSSGGSTSGDGGGDQAIAGESRVMEDGPRPMAEGGEGGPGEDDGGCAPGLTACDGGCVALSQPSSCGSCGHACTTTLANATAVCVGGTCASQCSPGFNLCAGQCIQFATATNCGRCGASCSADAGTPFCAGSAGSYSCVSGCPPAAPDLCGGTCVDEQTDTNNCGACGHACASGSRCTSGMCSGGTSSGGCAAGSTVFTTTCGGGGVSNFNSLGAVCVRFMGNVNGWNSSNAQGRTVTVTGGSTQTVTGSSNVPNQPAETAGSDGYVDWNFTAASSCCAFAGMSCW